MVYSRGPVCGAINASPKECIGTRLNRWLFHTREIPRPRDPVVELDSPRVNFTVPGDPPLMGLPTSSSPRNCGIRFICNTLIDFTRYFSDSSAPFRLACN